MSPGDAFVYNDGSGGHIFVLEKIEAINDSSGNLLKLKFICNEQTPTISRGSTFYSDTINNTYDYYPIYNDGLAQDYTWQWQ